ncbi:MAG: xanthine dehydrogenase family protein molybdopterin-binding subunit, partial [Actinomycetota bacterium]
MGIIGERVLRTEDPDLLTGKGTYIDNLVLPGAAHVVYVRSTVAHARIVSVDIDDARAMPGVLGVHTFADVDADGYGLVPNDHPMLPAQIRRPVLASDVVRYVGEPIVAVVAETRAQAVDAVEQVIVDYDPLPVVVDMEEAKSDQVVLFPDFGTNTVVKIPNGRDADFSACEVVIEARVVNQRLAPSPLEPRVAASRWEAPDANGVRRLTHWQACQGAHSVRAPICEMYGLPTEQVRVIVPDVGGGFGAKAFNYPEDILLPWLAKKHDRPVRYTETRTESMNGLGHGRAQVQYVKLGGTRDGRLLAYSLDVVQDSGAWPRFGAFLPVLTRRMATGTYDIPSVAFTASSVLTNTVPTIAYRGAGRPEAAAAIERVVDLFAAEIGMDAAEVRRRNVIAPDRFPFKNAVGTTYDSGQYAKALDLVLDAADYTALRAEQARR